MQGWFLPFLLMHFLLISVYLNPSSLSTQSDLPTAGLKIALQVGMFPHEIADIFLLAALISICIIGLIVHHLWSNAAFGRSFPRL